MTGCYVTMFVFTLVSLAIIDSDERPMHLSQQHLSPTVTMTGINRSGGQSSMAEHSAAKKRSSHVHGCPRNRVTEDRTVVSASEDVPEVVVTRAVSKSSPVQLPLEMQVLMGSSVKQVSERDAVKRPPKTRSKSPSRRWAFKRNRSPKTSMTNHAAVTVTDSWKPRVVSENAPLRGRRNKRDFLGATSECLNTILSPGFLSTTEGPYGLRTTEDPEYPSMIEDSFITTQGPDYDNTTLITDSDDNEDGLWYDVTTEDETISDTTDCDASSDIW